MLVFLCICNRKQYKWCLKICRELCKIKSASYYSLQVTSLLSMWQGFVVEVDIKFFFSCLYTLPIFNTSVFPLYLSKILVLFPCHACFHNLVKMKHFFLKYFSRYPHFFFVRKTKLWLYEYFLVKILSVTIILHLLTKVVLRFQKRFNPSKI